VCCTLLHEPSHSNFDQQEASFKMFTKLETKVLNHIYCLCCSIPSVPFTWTEGRMVLTHKQYSEFYNTIVWTLLLLVFSYQLATLPILIRQRDINGLVIHALFLVSNNIQIILKPNIAIYKKSITKLFNEVTVMNKSWGKFELTDSQGILFGFKMSFVKMSVRWMNLQYSYRNWASLKCKNLP